MAKLIKQIHDLVNLAIDKGVTDYIPSTKIDDVIDQGQMGLFRELLKTHPKTKRIRNYLLPFEEKESVTITNKIGELNATLTAGSFVVGKPYSIVSAGTTDFTLIGAADSNVGTIFIATGVGTGTGTAKTTRLFEHEIEAFVTVNSVKYPVKFVEPGFYRRRILDVVDPPSTTNLFATIYNDSGIKIEVSNDITPVELRYFRRPVKPVYAVQEIVDILAYDDANSIDLEWSDLVHDILMERTFKILGLNLREVQVMQSGQEMIPKEASL